MSGGEWEDLRKYKMSPVDCECYKSSDGESGIKVMQWMERERQREIEKERERERERERGCFI